VYREIVTGERVVTTERFDDAWYEGEGLGTVEFVEQEGRTTMTQTLRYVSKEVRDAALKSPMEGGVAMSFDKLAEILASQSAPST
ncbi:MAG: SRPBCC domain-containing protein, partial [Gemmatimonadales bacterium]